jgi:hypothetical protein
MLEEIQFMIPQEWKRVNVVMKKNHNMRAGKNSADIVKFGFLLEY